MTYQEPIFLLVFLPAVLLVYHLMPQKHRWKVLLAASYVSTLLPASCISSPPAASSSLAYRLDGWANTSSVQPSSTILP